MAFFWIALGFSIVLTDHLVGDHKPVLLNNRCEHIDNPALLLDVDSDLFYPCRVHTIEDRLQDLAKHAISEVGLNNDLGYFIVLPAEQAP